MTISSTDDPRAGPFNGNGSQTAFPFEFKAFAKEDLLVVQTDEDGLETTLVLDSDYSVSLNADQNADPGGTVTATIAPPTGETLTIISNLEFTQETDITNGGGFYPEVFETALDRGVMLVKQVNEKVDRALQVAVSTPEGVDTTLPVPDAQKIIGWNDTATGLVNRDITDFATVVAFAAWQSQTFDGDGVTTQFVLSSDPGNINNLDIAISGATQVPTIDFTLSGTTLTFLSAPPAGTSNVFARWGQALPQGTVDGSQIAFTASGTGAVQRDVEVKLRELAVGPEDFGAVGDGAQNDSNAWLACIASLNDIGARKMVCRPGANYLLDQQIDYSDIDLDLNGATVTFAFAAGSDFYGFGPQDNAYLHGGTITVAALGAPTSSNKECHAPIVVGRSGAGLAGYSNVRLYDLTLSTNRSGVIGGRGILIQSGSSNVWVDNITFPSSATMGACVQISWAGPGGNPPATSEHPYNIRVTNIKIGTMTKAGSSFDVAAIDIVGAYNVTVDNVMVDAWAGDAVLQVRVGGFGATVCPAAIAPLLFKNIKCSNFTVKSCSQHAVVVNGRANDAVGTPTYSVPAKIERINAVGPGLSSTYYGLRALHCGDVEFIDCDMSYFDRGGYVEENARRVKLTGGKYHHNNEQGIAVVHGTTGPRDITVQDTEVYLNGQDGTVQAGIYFENVTGLRAYRNYLNDETTETGQYFGLRIIDTCRFAEVEGNHGRSVRSGGNVYVIGSTNSYSVLKSYTNNTAAANIKGEEVYTGVNILTEYTGMDTNGFPLRVMRARNSAIPPSVGTFHRGDLMFHTDQAASTSMGEAGATQGTFSAFTDATGDTTNGSSVITGLTSTSGLVAGEYVTCSAGFSSTGPFRVLSVDGATQITVDATSNSTQANITVSTPDPVFKTMPALGA